MALRAVAAALLAFALSLGAELAVFTLIGPPSEVALDALGAPVAEEVAKRLAMLWLGAGWGLTGLAFGVLEGALKIAEWHAAGVAGGAASVMQHWAYGRFAEASRHGLWLAIGLHAGFNTTMILGSLALGSPAVWFAPVLAGLLLLASFGTNRFTRGR